MKYEEINLSELVDTISDTRKIDKDKVVLVNTSDVLAGEVLNHTYSDNCNLRGQFKKRFKQDDILYSEIRPANKRFAYIDFDSEDYIASTKLMVLRRKSDKITNRYLYYCLTCDSFVERMQHLAESRSGTFPQITFDVLKAESIHLPSVDNQNKITNILDNINNKIRINNEINNNLYEISKQLLLKYLDENSSSEEINISEILNVFTGNKNVNETSPTGKYKFFSCAPESMLSDTYLYDGAAIIVAGNGAYTGRTRFYDGKFELYQRTYGLTLKDGFDKSNIYGLYVFMKTIFEPDKRGGTHGSAIPYIVLSDLTNYKLRYDKNEFDKFSNLVSSNIKMIKKNEKSNEELSQLRDTLLPKLMNGEIDLDNIEI